MFSPAIIWFVHETPLEASRKSSSASTSETRGFDFVEDPVMAFHYNLFGFIPLPLQNNIKNELCLCFNHVNIIQLSLGSSTLLMAPFSFQSCLPYRLVNILSSSLRGPKWVWNATVTVFQLLIHRWFDGTNSYIRVGKQSSYTDQLQYYCYMALPSRCVFPVQRCSFSCWQIPLLRKSLREYSLQVSQVVQMDMRDSVVTESYNGKLKTFHITHRICNSDTKKSIINHALRQKNMLW